VKLERIGVAQHSPGTVLSLDRREAVPDSVRGRLSEVRPWGSEADYSWFWPCRHPPPLWKKELLLNSS
jgi:hypothetical protein